MCGQFILNGNKYFYTEIASLFILISLHVCCVNVCRSVQSLYMLKSVFLHVHDYDITTIQVNIIMELTSRDANAYLAAGQ